MKTFEENERIFDVLSYAYKFWKVDRKNIHVLYLQSEPLICAWKCLIK